MGGAEPGARRSAAWSPMRDQAIGWHLPLLAGLLPFLAGGLWVSGVANRLSFAAWGTVSGLLWFGALRLGLVRGWSWGRRAGALLLVAAAALAALAPLLAFDGAALETGLRAVAPALAPAVPGPTPTAAAAALFALAGLVLLAAGRARAVRVEASR